MSILGTFFKGDHDEVLFFILVFLLLFNGFGSKGYDGDDGNDNSMVLFFIILFLLLFFNSDNACDNK